MKGTVTIYYANSNKFRKHCTLQNLLKWIPSSLHDRAGRYKIDQDAYNFVLGRIMLQESLKKANINQSIDKLAYNEFDKPTIEGLYFSISHSQHLVACAVSEKLEVGLDIEFARDIDKQHFRHCFNDEEWLNITNDDSLHTFYLYWTGKEAVLKANGVGLSRLMDMKIHQHETADFFEAASLTKKWKLQRLFIEKEVAYACLCTEQDVKVNWKELNPNEYC